MIRCDKEWQGMIRCDAEILTWKLILKLPNEIGFVSNLGDKVG